MTEIERLAREIGTALGDCGAEEGSRFADEVAAVFAELVSEPPPSRRRRRVQARSDGDGPRGERTGR